MSETKLRIVDGVVERIGLRDVAPPTYVLRLRDNGETFRVTFEYAVGDAVALTTSGDRVELHLNQFGFCESFRNLTCPV